MRAQKLNIDGIMKIISGFLGGRQLKSSEGKGYRPAMGKVREALFSMLEAQGISWRQTSVLDVYAGTGSLAFEAISRGAQKACFLELDAKAVDCLNYNIENLQLQDLCKVIKGDASKVLSRPASEPYQLVFVDPPYGERKFQPTLQSIVKNGWLDANAFFVAEVEAAVKHDPNVEGLELLTDRTYGQTRILLYKKI